MPSSEEALKQAEGLDLSTNSSNSTSAFPKAASTHIALHSLANGQSHTPKRDRYVPRFADNPHRDDVFVLCGTGTRTLLSGHFFRAFNSTRAHRNTAALHVALQWLPCVWIRPGLAGCFRLLAEGRMAAAGRHLQTLDSYMETERNWRLAHRKRCMCGECGACCTPHGCAGCSWAYLRLQVPGCLSGSPPSPRQTAQMTMCPFTLKAAKPPAASE